jgi:predicted ATP-binding protein involved in virulence
MRLKEIHIKGTYKNLQDFKVSFEGDNFLEVFVGKNGTGKSNFFEAILEIFKHLSEEDYLIRFNYSMSYEINEETVFLEWEGVNWINKEKQKITPDKSKLPENILVYYSGHNKTIGNLLNTSNKNHKKLLDSKRKNDNLLSEVTRLFTGIDTQYKSLLLSVILLQENENKAKIFIKDKLGISTIGNEIRLDFKRPDYASNKIKFNEFVEDERFWEAKGYFKTLLNKIWGIGTYNFDGFRDQGLFGEKEDGYVLYKSFNSFKESFTSYSALELFIAFDNLKTIGYLDDLKIDVTLTSGKTIKIDQFSDGQFQSVYIYALTELFKDKNCITLLDEPDSFLHPEWQHKFLNQVNEISDASAKTNHVLMSSHSGITLIPFEKERVKYFDFKADGSINNYPLIKRIAIEKLSNSLIGYTEQEQILSIVNTIQIENKPVLFTEGKTDPIIIKEAWNKLYPEHEIPFIPFYAFGHRFVSQIMQDPEVIGDMNGLPIFGLFDFDKGFNTWNGFSTNNIENDIHKGLVKQIKSIEGNPPKNVYAIMLPAPVGLEITNQVINPANGNHWGDRSLMAIEHLFMHHPNLTDSFIVDESRPDSFKKFTGSKVRFAKDVVPTIDKEYFEVLEPMFEFINEKINI